MEIENTVQKLFSAQDGVINMKCRAVIVERKLISPAQPFTRKYALSEWICQNYLRVRLTRVISGCAVGGDRRALLPLCIPFQLTALIYE